jgi:hypothetical protein
VRTAIALLKFWAQEGPPKRRYVCFSCHDVMFKDSGVCIAITVNVKRYIPRKSALSYLNTSIIK